jgi:hypothetical protein
VRVGVGGVELGGVPDERHVLARLPPDDRQRTETGDEARQHHPICHAPRSPHEQADAQGQQRPVPQVVGVVPPAHAVVEVGDVARHVDLEGEADERVGGLGVARAGTSAAGPPADGDDQRSDR